MDALERRAQGDGHGDGWTDEVQGVATRSGFRDVRHAPLGSAGCRDSPALAAHRSLQLEVDWGVASALGFVAWSSCAQAEHGRLPVLIYSITEANRPGEMNHLRHYSPAMPQDAMVSSHQNLVE